MMDVGLSVTFKPVAPVRTSALQPLFWCWQICSNQQEAYIEITCLSPDAFIIEKLDSYNIIRKVLYLCLKCVKDL